VKVEIVSSFASKLLCESCESTPLKRLSSDDDVRVVAVDDVRYPAEKWMMQRFRVTRNSICFIYSTYKAKQSLRVSENYVFNRR